MSEDSGSLPDSDGLRRLADFCRLGVARTGVDAMTVTYANAFADLELLLATNAVSERVAVLEFTLGQGPGVDSISSGLHVAADDLDNPVAQHRWPQFAVESVAAGIRAVQAYPIVIDGRAFGVVALYSKDPVRLTSEQHRRATDITELIGLALVDPSSGGSIGSGLRMTVHQAAGMVMQQSGRSIQEALVLLRSAAFSEDRQVTDIAADVIAGLRRFDDIEIREIGDIHD